MEDKYQNPLRIHSRRYTHTENGPTTLVSPSKNYSINTSELILPFNGMCENDNVLFVYFGHSNLFVKTVLLKISEQIFSYASHIKEHISINFTLGENGNDAQESLLLSIPDVSNQKDFNKELTKAQVLNRPCDKEKLFGGSFTLKFTSKQQVKNKEITIIIGNTRNERCVSCNDINRNIGLLMENILHTKTNERKRINNILNSLLQFDSQIFAAFAWNEILQTEHIDPQSNSPCITAKEVVQGKVLNESEYKKALCMISQQCIEMETLNEEIEELNESNRTLSAEIKIKEKLISELSEKYYSNKINLQIIKQKYEMSCDKINKILTQLKEMNQVMSMYFAQLFTNMSTNALNEMKEDQLTYERLSNYHMSYLNQLKKFDSQINEILGCLNEKIQELNNVNTLSERENTASSSEVKGHIYMHQLTNFSFEIKGGETDKSSRENSKLKKIIYQKNEEMRILLEKLIEIQNKLFKQSNTGSANIHSSLGI